METLKIEAEDPTLNLKTDILQQSEVGDMSFLNSR